MGLFVAIGFLVGLFIGRLARRTRRATSEAQRAAPLPSIAPALQVQLAAADDAASAQERERERELVEHAIQSALDDGLAREAKRRADEAHVSTSPGHVLHHDRSHPTRQVLGHKLDPDFVVRVVEQRVTRALARPCPPEWRPLIVRAVLARWK